MQDKPVALVTGANRRAGFQIAKDLAAHGFTALVGSRNLEHGGRAAASIAGAALRPGRPASSCVRCRRSPQAVRQPAVRSRPHCRLIGDRVQCAGRAGSPPGLEGDRGDVVGDVHGGQASFGPGVGHASSAPDISIVWIQRSKCGHEAGYGSNYLSNRKAG